MVQAEKIVAEASKPSWERVYAKGVEWCDGADKVIDAVDSYFETLQDKERKFMKDYLAGIVLNNDGNAVVEDGVIAAKFLIDVAARARNKGNFDVFRQSIEAIGCDISRLVFYLREAEKEMGDIKKSETGGAIKYDMRLEPYYTSILSIPGEKDFPNGLKLMINNGMEDEVLKLLGPSPDKNEMNRVKSFYNVIEKLGYTSRIPLDIQGAAKKVVYVSGEDCPRAFENFTEILRKYSGDHTARALIPSMCMAISRAENYGAMEGLFVKYARDQKQMSRPA